MPLQCVELQGGVGGKLFFPFPEAGAPARPTVPAQAVEVLAFVQSMAMGFKPKGPDAVLPERLAGKPGPYDLKRPFIIKAGAFSGAFDDFLDRKSTRLNSSHYS